MKLKKSRKSKSLTWYNSHVLLVIVSVMVVVVILALVAYYYTPNVSLEPIDDSVDESNIGGQAFRIGGVSIPDAKDISNAAQEAADPCNAVTVQRIVPLQENNGAKFTILFIGDQDSGYTRAEDIRNDIAKLIDYNDDSRFDGLFSIEPFKSNRALFNIYFVRATVHTDLIQNGGASAKAASISLANCAAGRVRERYTNQIKNKKITHVVTLSKESFRSICIPETPCLVSVGSSVDRNDARLVIHEFAHGFGGLADEYVDADATESLAELRPISRTLFGKSINHELDFYQAIGIIAPPNCASNRAWPQSETGCGFSNSLYKPTGETIMGHSGARQFGSINEQRLREVIEGRANILKRGSAVDKFQKYK